MNFLLTVHFSCCAIKNFAECAFFPAIKTGIIKGFSLDPPSTAVEIISSESPKLRAISTEETSNENDGHLEHIG